MNEKQAWNLFACTGKIEDYLNFKNIQQTKDEKSTQNADKRYESFHNRADTQTTEYR